MSTYLVTGANRGIGLEYCRQLKQRGERVIAVCRSSSEELNWKILVLSGMLMAKFCLGKKERKTGLAHLFY